MEKSNHGFRQHLSHLEIKKIKKQKVKEGG